MIRPRKTVKLAHKNGQYIPQDSQKFSQWQTSYHDWELRFDNRKKPEIKRPERQSNKPTKTDNNSHKDRQKLPQWQTYR